MNACQADLEIDFRNWFNVTTCHNCSTKHSTHFQIPESFQCLTLRWQIHAKIGLQSITKVLPDSIESRFSVEPSLMEPWII